MPCGCRCTKGSISADLRFAIPYGFANHPPLPRTSSPHPCPPNSSRTPRPDLSPSIRRLPCTHCLCWKDFHRALNLVDVPLPDRLDGLTLLHQCSTFFLRSTSPFLQLTPDFTHWYGLRHQPFGLRSPPASGSMPPQCGSSSEAQTHFLVSIQNFQLLFDQWVACLCQFSKWA